jgi:hypothetical protein
MLGRGAPAHQSQDALPIPDDEESQPLIAKLLSCALDGRAVRDSMALSGIQQVDTQLASGAVGLWLGIWLEPGSGLGLGLEAWPWLRLMVL